MSTNTCGVITCCLMLLTVVFAVVTLNKFYAQESVTAPKQAGEAPEITELKSKTARNRELILAGAEGAFLAAQRGISHAEYIQALSAQLNALEAIFIDEENKRLGIKATP